MREAVARGLAVCGVLLVAVCVLAGQAPSTIVPVIGGTTRFANGTSGVPSVSFLGSAFDGWYWASTGHVVYVTQGNQAVDFGTGVTLPSTYTVGWVSNTTPAGGNPDTVLARGGGAGLVVVGGNSTIASVLKADALPTVASGFGTSPAIVAGSTALAGAINVGTGAPGTGGVVNFNGTAFPSAPFVVCMDDSSLLIVRCTATTTQLTIAATALTASDVVSWHAVSSK